MPYINQLYNLVAGSRYTSSFGSQLRHQLTSEDAYWKRRMPGVTLHVVSGMLENLVLNHKAAFIDTNSHTMPIMSCFLQGLLTTVCKDV